MGIVLIIVLSCSRNLARKVPTNYILLLFFTLCEAYIVAYCCAVVGDAKLVLSAAFMTAGIVVGLTIYSMTTKTDFTFFGGMLYVVGSAFILFSLFSFFFGPTARLIYCTLGVILFGVYLVFDTQLIIGGRNHELDKEDYIFGAIILYLDILNIFLYVL